MFPWHGVLSGAAGTTRLARNRFFSPAADRPVPGADVPGPALSSAGGVGGPGDLAGPAGPAVVFLAPRDRSLAVTAVPALPAVPGGMFRLPELRDRRLEVLERVEGPVDGGEPQVGDEVELLQRAEYGQSHVVGGQLGASGGAHRLLDPLAELGQRVLGDRPALARLAHAVDDLGAAEGLGDPGPLDHHERARLHGRETTGAVGALAAPADGRAVVRRTAVDDTAVGVPAEGAVHEIPTLLTADTMASPGHSGPTKRLQHRRSPRLRRPGGPQLLGRWSNPTTRCGDWLIHTRRARVSPSAPSAAHVCPLSRSAHGGTRCGSAMEGPCDFWRCRGLPGGLVRLLERSWRDSCDSWRERGPLPGGREA